MLDESSNLNNIEPEPQPEEKGNRTFLIVGGIFAALIFLTLVFMALYFVLIRPRLAVTQAAQDATAAAQRLEQAQAMTSTAAAAQFTPTPQPTSTPSRTPSQTQFAATTAVVVLATGTLTDTPDPALLSAAQTQLSGQMTQTAAALVAGAGAGFGPTGTEVTRAIGGEGPLPATGFFDEVGLPLLIVLTFTLLLVIFIARRMRKPSSH